LAPVGVPFEWDGSAPSQAAIRQVLADAATLLAHTATPRETQHRSSRYDKPILDDYDVDPDRMMIKRYIALIENWELIDADIRGEIEDPELLPLGKAVTYLNYIIHTWTDVRGSQPEHKPPPRPDAMLERTRREIYWQEPVDCISVYCMVETDLREKLSARGDALRK